MEPQLSDAADQRRGAFAAVVVGGWAAMFVCCIAIGALITGPLRDSALVRWDRQYPVDLEAARTAMGKTWSSYGSLLGDTLTVVAVAVAVGVVLLILKRWASVMLLATALLAEVSIFVSTTIVVPRDRPEVEQLDVSPPTSSFPSGHTAAATALVFSLAVIIGWHVRSTLVRVIAWVIALAVGPIVGFSRIYRGMHQPLDVVVGLLLGVACVFVALVAVRTWVGAASSVDETSDSTGSGRHAMPESENPTDDQSDSRVAS